MSDIIKFIGLESERKAIQDKLTPLQNNLNTIVGRIRELSNNLSFEEKKFIQDKLWEAMSEQEQSEVLKARKDLNDMMNNAYLYSLQNTPFDPIYDAWELISYEKNDEGKIRLTVSCKKNEGSISGLMTFLDIHETAWFSLGEIPS